MISTKNYLTKCLRQFLWNCVRAVLELVITPKPCIGDRLDGTCAQQERHKVVVTRVVPIPVSICLRKQPEMLDRYQPVWVWTDQILVFIAKLLFLKSQLKHWMRGTLHYTRHSSPVITGSWMHVGDHTTFTITTSQSQMTEKSYTLRLTARSIYCNQPPCVF